MDEPGKWCSGTVSQAHIVFFKTDALIFCLHRSHATAPLAHEASVTFSDDGWNMLDFVAPLFSQGNAATYLLKSLGKETADEIGLELAGLGFFHLFFDSKNSLFGHGLFAQSVSIKDAADMRSVHDPIYLGEQCFLSGRVISISDGFNKQVFQALPLKNIAQNVKNSAVQCFAFRI